MDAAKFHVPANRVGANRRREERDELGGERRHRGAECRALGGRMAGDLVEAGGLDERRDQRRDGEAGDPPATQTQAQDEGHHDLSSLGLGSLK